MALAQIATSPVNELVNTLKFAMLNKLTYFATAVFLSVLVGQTNFAQTESGTNKSGSQSKNQTEKENESGSDTKDDEFAGSTVKGRLVQHDKKEFHIALANLNPTFNQQPQLPQPPIPKNWAELTVEQRQNWVKEFEASDKGKSFLENRKAIIQSAPKFDLKVEDNGNFVVYDVPAGTYGLRGRIEKVINDKNYVFEVFGLVVVSENVEEVLLDPITVTVTRLLKSGEAVPEFSIPTFDGKHKITRALLDSKDVKDHHILLSFWSLESPPSKEFSKQIQAMYAKVKQDNKLQLISICIQSDPKKALEYVKTVRVKGWHGHADSWEHDMVNEFGVRVIPALFLLSPDGKVVMTHADFQRAFQAQDANLTTVVTEGVIGKFKPFEPPSDSEQ